MVGVGPEEDKARRAFRDDLLHVPSITALFVCLSFASDTVGISQGGTYEGDWQNRAPHGQGRMVYSDGSVYVGGWKDFKFHGHGKLVQEGGVVFEGEFREGCMHGSGSAEARKLDVTVDS